MSLGSDIDTAKDMCLIKCWGIIVTGPQVVILQFRIIKSQDHAIVN